MGDREAGTAGAGYVAVDPYGNPNLRYGLPRIPSYFAWAKRRPGAMLRRQLV